MADSDEAIYLPTGMDRKEDLLRNLGTDRRELLLCNLGMDPLVEEAVVGAEVMVLHVEMSPHPEVVREIGNEGHHSHQEVGVDMGVEDLEMAGSMIVSVEDREVLNGETTTVTILFDDDIKSFC